MTHFVSLVFHLTAPCSGKWIDWNKCDQLINGTNSSWYKIHSRGYWCESFKTCFDSQNLKYRCRRDLRFYDYHFWYWKFPAFTSEVSSYVSNTRIQIYPCSNPYIFGVNVIRCDSVAKNNGSGRFNILTAGGLLKDKLYHYTSYPLIHFTINLTGFFEVSKSRPGLCWLIAFLTCNIFRSGNIFSRLHIIQAFWI